MSEPDGYDNPQAPPHAPPTAPRQAPPHADPPPTAPRQAPPPAPPTADPPPTSPPPSPPHGPPTPDPPPHPPPLTPTGRVILGMIAVGRQTGYDIKQLVDKSTRHFWAASYGQIYPELRRLEEQGLVRGHDEPRGGRARTVYQLTDAGDAALQRWLQPAAEPTFEVRDEGMLRLFFSDLGTADQRVQNLRAMRRLHENTLAQLRALEAGDALEVGNGLGAGEGREAGDVLERGEGHMGSGPALTLELGIGLHEWMVEWCAAAERRLTGAKEAPTEPQAEPPTEPPTEPPAEPPTGTDSC